MSPRRGDKYAVEAKMSRDDDDDDDDGDDDDEFDDALESIDGSIGGTSSTNLSSLNAKLGAQFERSYKKLRGSTVSVFFKGRFILM